MYFHTSKFVWDLNFLCYRILNTSQVDTCSSWNMAKKGKFVQCSYDNILYMCVLYNVCLQLCLLKLSTISQWMFSVL